MIDLARRNAKAKGVKPPQVAFVQASLTEELPIESSSVDCVLSNCVLNLLPGTAKGSILKEAYRVLKPGGRVHLSDVSLLLDGNPSLLTSPNQIVAIRDIPDKIKDDLGLYVNCVSGAISRTEYEKLLQDAGFEGVHPFSSFTYRCLNPFFCIEISLLSTGVDLSVYYSGSQQQGPSCCGRQLPVLGGEEAKPSINPNEFIGALADYSSCFGSCH